MTSITVDTVTLTFSGVWLTEKPDDWAFYRNQFIKLKHGVKSVDVVALDSASTAWLIEVKDYRMHIRTKPLELADEVAHKVFDTLAMMIPARLNASVASERLMASKVCSAAKVRVVLQLEQPAKHSRLRPIAIDPAALMMKLKKTVRAIDPGSVKRTV